MKIQICTWKSCKSRYSEYILKRLKADIEKFKFEKIEIETTPCQWYCEKWPNVLYDWKREHYQDPIKASKHMIDTIKQRKK